MDAPKPGPKLEPVSARLKGSLIHPNRTGPLFGLRYSPDGKRLVAGDYPAGVLIVWDVATGKQLTKIETGRCYRGWIDYFSVSPDWRTVYAPWKKRSWSRLEKDGKRLVRWEFDSGVRAWDLDTGVLRGTFQHAPPRGVWTMLLAPDGSTFVTIEVLPGEWEGQPKSVLSLWDVKTGRSQALPIGWPVVYSPDGKTLAVPADDEQQRQGIGLTLVDALTTTAKASIPIPGQGASVYPRILSPDGGVLVATVESSEPRRQRLSWWDTGTRKEVASFEPPGKELFGWAAFSPDGRSLAVTGRNGEQGKLFLFDVPGKKLRQTIMLGEKVAVCKPIVSPDGKWFAVITQFDPDSELSAEDLPQPRVHLIDAVTGALRETLVAPQAAAAIAPVMACFSPDGKTLATSGNGKVLLWDLTRPPGSGVTRREP